MTPLGAIVAVIGLVLVARCMHAVMNPTDNTTSPPREHTAAAPPPVALASVASPLGEMLALKHLVVMYKGSQKAPPTVTRTKEQAKTRAEEALAKVRSGTSFESVVKEYTDEPGGAARGGDLGTFLRGSSPPAFETALATMAVGEISSVVETPFGFHVILRTAPTRSINAAECAKLGGELFERIDPATGDGQTVCRPKTLDPIERACGVSRGLQEKYTKQKEERFDIPGANRLNVRISVPPDLSRADLEANVRHALLTSYETARVKLGAVDVLAYASDRVDGAFTAARGSFAPDGQWSQADSAIPAERWRVTIEFEESYFAPRPTTFGVNAQIVLTADPGGTIGISRSPSSWTDEDIFVRVGPGTKARILSVKEFGSIARYEVETLDAPKKRGWVTAYAVRSP